MPPPLPSASFTSLHKQRFLIILFMVMRDKTGKLIVFFTSPIVNKISCKNIANFNVLVKHEHWVGGVINIDVFIVLQQANLSGTYSQTFIKRPSI